jgi:hypothetical protein
MTAWVHVHEEGLLCPLCGQDGLHLKRVSAEFSDLQISFWCEHCPETKDEPVVLSLTQHKGSTLILWDRDRD